MILKNAFIHSYPEGAQVAHGEIYGDQKGRFMDCTPVRTSRIIEIRKDQKNGKCYIDTMNSTYEIEYAEGAEIPEAHKEVEV